MLVNAEFIIIIFTNKVINVLHIINKIFSNMLNDYLSTTNLEF